MALQHGPTPKIKAPTLVTSGLVLHLDASNVASYPRSGNIWYDLSGIIGSININNRNADWQFRQDGDTGIWGLFNEGLVNRPVTATPGISIPMNNGFNRSAGTIDIWVKPMKDHTGAHGFFISADSLSYNGTSGWLWFGGWDQNEYFYARQSNPTTCCNDVAFGGFTTNYYYLNSWMNYTFTWDVPGAFMAVYKNGKLVASRSDMPTNIPTTVLAPTGLLFSNHTRDDNIQFKGFCNTYRIYNRKLSDAEVLQNFLYTSDRFK